MFQKIELNDIGQIQTLAHDIWPKVYANLLSSEQICFMLDLMYNLTTLTNDIKRGVEYYVLRENEEAIGFFGIEPNSPADGYLRLHKLYLKKEHHGKGYGKGMLQQIEVIANNKGLSIINLNVNRQNEAVKVYQRQGYTITAVEDIPIGNDFLMEDYQMEKKIL